MVVRRTRIAEARWGREAGAHDRALPWFGVDPEPAAERSHAFGETAQAGAPSRSAPPTPSSLTSTASCPSRWVKATEAFMAEACLAALVSASETTK
jgi:hypothetical protein